MSAENTEQARVRFEAGFKSILEGLTLLGYNREGDENFVGTDKRAAKGFAELVLDKRLVEDTIKEMFKKTFPAKYRDMVISKHNVAFGICPHHLLPVIYRISVAYIPTSKVLGISKLSRLTKLLARAPMLQEDLTHELSNRLHEDLESEGAATYVEGLHMCMAARGAGAHETRVVTSSVRGVFLESKSTRDEFIKLVTAAHPTLI